MDSPLLESQAWERRNVILRVLWVDMVELKKQIGIAIPMIITNMCVYAIILVSVMFAGHLGELELAAATLANSWAIVTGFALMTGLSGALETLCGQGYGAKAYRMLGIYLQSSIISTLLFSIIISVVWFYAEPILICLHQNAEVSRLASVYLTWLIPGIYAYSCLQCLTRFLQTQSIVLPLILCSAIPLAIEAALSYLLVFKTSLGFRGAALAASISLWLSFLLLALYVHLSKEFKDTWQGVSVESFRYILPFMKLGLPSAVMVCLEYWAFEILVLLAGMLPKSEESTALIAMCVNTESIAYMITFGFSAAVSTRVSNEIGAGNPVQAKNAVSVTLKLAIVFAAILVISLVCGHNIWAGAFSSIPRIKQGFASMTPLLAASILLDAAQGVLSGVSRGCGWQHFGAWTNLAAFYGIGVPISCVLAFKFDLDIKGFVRKSSADPWLLMRPFSQLQHFSGHFSVPILPELFLLHPEHLLLVPEQYLLFPEQPEQSVTFQSSSYCLQGIFDGATHSFFQVHFLLIQSTGHMPCTCIRAYAGHMPHDIIFGLLQGEMGPTLQIVPTCADGTHTSNRPIFCVQGTWAPQMSCL